MNLSVKILQQTQIIMKKEGRKLRESPAFTCISIYAYSSSNKLSCSCFLPLLSHLYDRHPSTGMSVDNFLYYNALCVKTDTYG